MTWRQRLAAAFPITRGARYSVVVLFCLSLAIGGANLMFTSRVVGAESRTAATLTQLCQSGNLARAQQVTLWEHLVVISKPPAHESVQARAARLRTTAAFLAYVRRVFAPRNCAHPSRTERP